MKDSRSENGSGDRDEGAVYLRLAVLGGDDVSGRQEGDFGAGGDVAVCGWGDEHGESLRKIALRMVIAARFKRELP